MPASHDLLGPEPPTRAVILSVPHAGRDYPPELLAAARLSEPQMRALEDRHVDLLASDAAEAGFTVLIARRPRAWIDLNRDAREIDPEMIEPRPPREALLRSSRVASGLGLLPRRLRGIGDVLRQRVPLAALHERIESDYRPYHARLSALLAAAKARFGVAVLLDLHSMPPLGEGATAQVVIGDRFGASAAARFGAALRATAAAQGFSVAENTPYAGGHILAQHGRPKSGIHAIQLEIDRSLYLDAALDGPGKGVARMARLVRACAESLSAEAAGGHAIAAE